jgi:hypothetical protein
LNADYALRVISEIPAYKGYAAARLFWHSTHSGGYRTHRGHFGCSEAGRDFLPTLRSPGEILFSCGATVIRIKVHCV